MTSPSITDAERVIMEIVWHEAPLGSAEIARRAQREQDWSPKTVQTLIARLVGKRALAREPAGRGYRYRPAVARGDYIAARGRGLIRRLFGGRVTPLVAAFAETDSIAADDLEQLRALVERLERNERALSANTDEDNGEDDHDRAG